MLCTVSRVQSVPRFILGGPDNSWLPGSSNIKMMKGNRTIILRWLNMSKIRTIRSNLTVLKFYLVISQIGKEKFVNVSEIIKMKIMLISRRTVIKSVLQLGDHNVYRGRTRVGDSRDSSRAFEFLFVRLYCSYFVWCTFTAFNEERRSFESSSISKEKLAKEIPDYFLNTAL
jgi:hypothetical protein